jgi:hypothetical protein
MAQTLAEFNLATWLPGFLRFWTRNEGPGKEEAKSSRIASEGAMTFPDEATRSAGTGPCPSGLSVASSSEDGPPFMA